MLQASASEVCFVTSAHSTPAHRRTFSVQQAQSQRHQNAEPAPSRHCQRPASSCAASPVHEVCFVTSARSTTASSRSSSIQRRRGQLSRQNRQRTAGPQRQQSSSVRDTAQGARQGRTHSAQHHHVQQQRQHRRNQHQHLPPSSASPAARGSAAATAQRSQPA